LILLIVIGIIIVIILIILIIIVIISVLTISKQTIHMDTLQWTQSTMLDINCLGFYHLDIEHFA